MKRLRIEEVENGYILSELDGNEYHEKVVKQWVFVDLESLFIRIEDIRDEKKK